MKGLIHIILSIATVFTAMAQKDSLPKIHHAEPLYMDLIRDLGARRGERELNIGGALQMNKQYTSYAGFVEYEFAPFNRLGMEVELPLSLYHPHALVDKQAVTPKNRLEGLKLSAQYTFLVSPEQQLSVAFGYTNQLIFHSFKTLSAENKLAKGNLYSPFFIAAKRWGKHINTMLITGLLYEQKFSSDPGSFGYQIHASIFYTCMKNNFFGFEINHIFINDMYSTIIHPQVKIKIGAGLAVGIVTAIPVGAVYEPSVFLRFIYEPKRRV